MSGPLKPGWRRDFDLARFVEFVGPELLWSRARVVTADGEIVRAPPQEEAVSNTPTIAEVQNAIRETEYKYFGDYELSEQQHEAVATLVAVACLWLLAQGCPRKVDERGYTIVDDKTPEHGHAAGT